MQKRIVWDDSPLYSLRVFCVLQSSGARMIWPPFILSTRSLATCFWRFLLISLSLHIDLNFIWASCLLCISSALLSILSWFSVFAFWFPSCSGFKYPKRRQRRDDASCQVNFLYMLVGSIRSEIILSFSTSFFLFYPLPIQASFQTKQAWIWLRAWSST